MDLSFETYNLLKIHIENSSFIYIIYSEYGCKIGYTRSPLERIEQIKQGLPSQNCFFIGLYLNEKSNIYEKKLHKIFKPQKISGEWFILNDENIDFIDNYLVKRNFKCLIKKSILWSNYLLPSIYIEGKVKVIRKINKNKTNLEIIVPRLFEKLVSKPDINDINNKSVEFLTPSQISERFKTIGIDYNPVTIGKYLTNLKFERKSKRIPNIGPRIGYYVIMKKNVPNIGS